jgi:hypothetical protein
MGSVGQYAGEKSFIRDVVIENVWLLNGQVSHRPLECRLRQIMTANPPARRSSEDVGRA